MTGARALAGRSHRLLTLVRFALVGASTVAVYVCLLLLAVEAAGLPPWLGAAAAYAIAVGFNYYAHYNWTYRSASSHRQTGPRYLAVIAVILVVNAACTKLLPLWFGVGYSAVQLGLAAVIALMTCVMQAAWVFKGKGAGLERPR